MRYSGANSSSRREKGLRLLLLLLILSVSSQFTPGYTAGQFTNSDDKSNKKEQQRPIIKNPTYRDETIYMDVSGSSIEFEKARLIVDGKETFPLNLDDSRVFFHVGHEKTSSPGGLKINQAIPKDKNVSIVVENPNGTRSEEVSFRR